jgi:hypothetical protein
MDKIVFDIETKNILSDPNVQNDLLKLDISVVGAYSYDRDEYFCFEEQELPVLEEMMKKAGLIIGFYSKKFDVPVLNKYFNFNLEAIPHFDILDEIEKSFGRRISLDLLGEANLGIKKDGTRARCHRLVRARRDAEAQGLLQTGREDHEGDFRSHREAGVLVGSPAEQSADGQGRAEIRGSAPSAANGTFLNRMHTSSKRERRKRIVAVVVVSFIILSMILWEALFLFGN